MVLFLIKTFVSTLYFKYVYCMHFELNKWKVCISNEISAMWIIVIETVFGNLSAVPY